MDLRARAEALLEADLLTYVSHLKMIQTFGDTLDYSLQVREADWGLSLTYPTAWSAYDRATYPEAMKIVYLAASRPPLLDGAVEALPCAGPLVFKLTGQDQAACVAKRYALTRKRAYWMYTTGGAAFPPEPQVRRLSHPDAQAGALWALNGYGAQEIQAHFQSGGQGYALYEGDIPVSACFVYPNYRHVWEIAGVHTASQARGKGYAKRVVCAALHDLAAKGRLPRYNVLDTNEPSIRLAESLGLWKASTLTHFMAEPL